MAWNYAIILQDLLMYMMCSLLGFIAYLVFSRGKQIERAVREETGERHAVKKHTPDMGGIVMMAVFGLFFFRRHDTQLGELMMVFPIVFGLTGLADDVVKSRFKNTKGIPARYRILLQALAGIIFIYMTRHHFRMDLNPTSSSLTGTLIFAFCAFIFLLATVNAANFTDGLDGLLAGCILIPLIGFLIAFRIYDGDLFGYYLKYIVYKQGFLIILGIIIIFLIYNWNPAKIFMGDGGSMFLGAYLACFAILNGMILPVLLAALPIYLELLSVVIQVVSFRLTGKRVFPMTPIHHSFEKWGWSERKIVLLFYAATFVCTATTIAVMLTVYGPKTTFFER